MSWSHWEQFLEHDLEKLGTIPDCNTGCPLLVLQTASHYRVQASESADNEGTADGQALEEILNERREFQLK